MQSNLGIFQGGFQLSSGRQLCLSRGCAEVSGVKPRGGVGMGSMGAGLCTHNPEALSWMGHFTSACISWEEQVRLRKQ